MAHRDKERAKEYSREYRKKNSKRLNAYLKQRRLNNPEKSRELSRRFREKHPEKVAENNARQRAKPGYAFMMKRACAKRFGIQFSLSEVEFNNRPVACPQCHRVFGESKRDRPELDRLVPELGYVSGNVEWICGTCNRKKQDMSYPDMLKFAALGMARHEKA